MSESSKHSDIANNIDENDDIGYTHPIVTEKKGYTDLTDYERNYKDMESRAKMQHIKNPIDEESMKSKMQDDQSKERESDTIAPKSSTNENNRERYTEEPKATTSKMTEKNENGKIDILTNKTREHGNASMDSSQEIDESKDDSNTSELTDISPEEAYIRHMERVIAANTLPPQNMEILKDLYTRYSTDKNHASTIEETRAETDMDTSNLSESKTDSHDHIEKQPIYDDEKSILNPSLKDLNNGNRSSTQEVSKNSVLNESLAMDDEKMESLENTDLFVNNDEILTSTPKSSTEKISSSSNLENIKNICDVTNMTIESPFSDFSLQTVKLKTGLKSLNVIKEEDNNLVEKGDNKEHSSVIKEEVNVTGIDQNQPNSSSLSSSSQYPTSLDVSKNVRLSNEKNVPLIKNDESFITDDDLACQCPQIEADAISNENNNVESITDRIRRYFLSLLVDYLVPRQVRTTKIRVSCI